MMKLPLHENWTVRPVGDLSPVPEALREQTITATVPGCIHTDLLAAELIPDPYLDQNEKLVQWIGQCSWQYRCRLELDAATLGHDRLDLACDGLDTLATIELNGQSLGQAQDMHLRHRCDAKAAARAGSNELVITFAPPLPQAEALRNRLGNLPAQGSGSNQQLPHNFIRKMACNFGWDWGPRLITSGIWRDLRLEAWNTVRIADVRPVTDAIKKDGTVNLTVHADLQRHAEGDLTLRAELAGHDTRLTWSSRLHGNQTRDPIHFAVAHAKLWNPVGYGEAHRYDLRVWIEDARGQRMDEIQQRIGLRTVEIDTAPDPADRSMNQLGTADDLPAGATMTLKVNGQPVFCKGANWIPDDCFPSRITKKQLRQRITQARDAHMNMLRVWGGGTYESHDFYDLCDELGMLVWQDFLMACAGYAEEEPLLSLIEAEARDNVARLAAHPSLVMWCGNNENLWAWDEWKHEDQLWRDYIGDRGWGPHYYFKVFPPIVEQLAPDTAYWPGSPYSSPDQPQANADGFGDKHIWDVWHGPGQYRNYLSHAPRFASEFGYHGPPSWPNIVDSIPEDQWSWNSDGMNHHNKNSSDRPGQPHTHARMGDDFIQPDTQGDPESFNDWLYLAQIMQARALDMGCTWFRASGPIAPAPCTGNSTTAGPSPAGPPSTATATPNPSGTPPVASSPPACSPLNPGPSPPPATPPAPWRSTPTMTTPRPGNKSSACGSWTWPATSAPPKRSTSTLRPGKPPVSTSPKHSSKTPLTNSSSPSASMRNLPRPTNTTMTSSPPPRHPPSGGSIPTKRWLTPPPNLMPSLARATQQPPSTPRVFTSITSRSTPRP